MKLMDVWGGFDSKEKKNKPENLCEAGNWTNFPDSTRPH